MKIDPSNGLILEAKDAMLVVFGPTTVRVLRHAIAIQLGSATSLEREHLEYADAFLIFMESRRHDDVQQRAEQGIKAYWETGVPSTDNGGAKPDLKVVKNDSE